MISKYFVYILVMKKPEVAAVCHNLPTTDTELIAIAADPIHGCNLNPQGENIPAATGMPIML